MFFWFVLLVCSFVFFFKCLFCLFRGLISSRKAFKKGLFFDEINIQNIKDRMFQIGFSPRRIDGHH